MTACARRSVLLTGATGFVGRHLHPVLERAGYRVVGASRAPAAASARYGAREFRYLDVEEPESIARALSGCEAAVYLIHAMAGGRGYEDRERRAAEGFLSAAEQAGVSRIVYLGGPRPRGPLSRHLRSRLATGEILRSGKISTIELQATMVIGAGSESWRIVRDLAARLPFMILPRWLENQSEPIGIDDVTRALCEAIAFPQAGSASYALPGPEVLSGREILQRTAALLGSEPGMVRVPVITPRLSSYWIRLVTRANGRVADELVEGLESDLRAENEGFWQFLPEHERQSFDEAARRAIAAGESELTASTRAAESLLRRLSAVAPKAPRVDSH